MIHGHLTLHQNYTSLTDAIVLLFARSRGAHPQAHLANYAGILQADAYGGYGKLCEANRRPGPITQGACWSHARRKFFVLADLAVNAKRKAQGKTPAFVAPVALAAVRRTDALFDIERDISGNRRSVSRFASRSARRGSKNWRVGCVRERAKFSRHNAVAKAMDYMLNRWQAFIQSLHDGRICLTNNVAEGALRGIALGRKEWLFGRFGSGRAAMIYRLIITAKLNNINPQAWLADVLARIADHPVQKLDKLLPWNWTAASAQIRNAQAACRHPVL